MKSLIRFIAVTTLCFVEGCFAFNWNIRGCRATISHVGCEVNLCLLKQCFGKLFIMSLFRLDILKDGLRLLALQFLASVLFLLMLASSKGGKFWVKVSPFRAALLFLRKICVNCSTDDFEVVDWEGEAAIGYSGWKCKSRVKSGLP